MKLRTYNTNASYRLEICIRKFHFQVDWWYNKLFRRNQKIPLEFSFYDLRT